MDKENILIVEDDSALAKALKITVENAGYMVEVAHDIETAKYVLSRKNYSIVLCDVELGTQTGLTLLEYIKKTYYKVVVILMTAYGKIKDAVWAMQHGAQDYLTKPFSAEELLFKITQLCQQQKTIQQLVQQDCTIKNILLLAQKVANTDASVMISGESGTGKEVLAKYVHEKSPRCHHPFIAINCAAIPENMLEAMLFGHEKGAFTGACQTVEGKLEQANGGTVLLDEISEMPMHLQAKLLRVIQEKEVERLGSKKTIKLNVRFISTANRNLSLMVENNLFRQDLYFRLNVMPITLPPLRKRPQDILPLAEKFISMFEQNQPDVRLSVAAEKKLLSYSWPGNIRELQNVIQRALIYAKHTTIEDEDLIFENTQESLTTEKSIASLEEELLTQENSVILQVLKETNNNRSGAAQILNISERTLRNKLSRMKKMGLI